MASSKNYWEFVLEQLSGLDDVTYRSMMGSIFFTSAARLLKVFMTIAFS